MAAPIGDEKATIFATRFYQSLAAGDDPQTAFDKACNALRMEGFRDEAHIPQMR